MISVCIPTYNGALYLKEQLKSILNQLTERDEVIISDDSSTDATLSVIKDLSDSRIVVLKDNKFRSPTYNIENAINYSKGDIIILADQDDVWLPGRVAEIVSELRGADLVLTNAFIVDDQLNKTGKTLFDALNSGTGIFKNIKKNSYVGCCLAFKSVLKTKLLPFPMNLPMHDQWIGLVAEIFYNVKLIPNPLLLYRRHESNTSDTGNKSKNSIFKKIKYRLKIISVLLFYAIRR